MDSQVKKSGRAPAQSVPVDAPEVNEGCLHTAVAAAALAAQRAGAYAETTALHSIEIVLGALRLRLGEAREVLSSSHPELLARLEAFV